MRSDGLRVVYVTMGSWASWSHSIWSDSSCENWELLHGKQVADVAVGFTKISKVGTSEALGNQLRIAPGYPQQGFGSVTSANRKL